MDHDKESNYFDQKVTTARNLDQLLSLSSLFYCLVCVSFLLRMSCLTKLLVLEEAIVAWYHVGLIKYCSRLDNEQKLNMDKLESEETQISELKIQVTYSERRGTGVEISQGPGPRFFVKF